ncbi:MAG: hypothetical protein WKG01_00915 [Kofleriaceae bacterium]
MPNTRGENPVAWVSLGLPLSVTTVMLFGGLGAIGAVVKATHLSMHGTSGAATGIAIFGTAFAALLVLPSVITRRLRLAKLQRSSIPFDRASYFEALGSRAAEGALEVEVKFETTDTPNLGNLTMVETSVSRPSPGALLIVSPTSRTLRGSALGTYHYNGELAGWFERALRGPLEALHRRHKITDLRVRFIADPKRGQQADIEPTPDLPQASIVQRKGTVHWMIGGALAAIALAIAAGLADAPHYLTGLVSGVLFVATVVVGAVTCVLFQLRGRNPDGALLRRPLEWLGNSMAYSVVAFFVLALGSPMLFGLGEPGAAHRWYTTGFFIARIVAYFLVWASVAAIIDNASSTFDATGSSKNLDKLGRRAPRIVLILAVILFVACLDWIVGIHREALARWLAPLALANLLAGGIAAAVAIGVLAGRRLERMQLVGALATPKTHAYAGRWIVGGLLAWIVTATGIAVATLASPADQRAAWEPHVLLGTWRGFTAINVGLHVLALLVLVAPAARRSGTAIAIASWLVVLAHVAAAVQFVVPAGRGPDLPTWIELGGFVTALLGIWIVMFQSMGERIVVARRFPPG